MERARSANRGLAQRERVRLVAFNRADHFGRRLYLSGRHRARACRFPGPAIGTDFSNVYAAGTYVRDGNPDAPFDLARWHAREQQIFGASATPFYGWHNPPFFLFVAAALAPMPYGLALAI